MTAFFVLMMLVVQIGMLSVARTTIEASVDGAARNAAMHPSEAGSIERRLMAELAAVVPGSDDVDVQVGVDEEVVSVVARLRWRPPGPDLVPIVVSVGRERKVVVPP